MFLKCFDVVVAIQMTKQNYKFLYHGFDPRQSAWKKPRQLIREGNLVALIDVHRL